MWHVVFIELLMGSITMLVMWHVIFIVVELLMGGITVYMMWHVIFVVVDFLQLLKTKRKSKLVFFKKEYAMKTYQYKFQLLMSL